MRIPSVVWAVAVLVLTTGGCGADSESSSSDSRPKTTQTTERREPSVPRPTETPAAATEAIVRAARRGGCRALAVRMHGRDRAARCRNLRRSGALKAIAKLDGRPGTYGTAAVAEINSA